MLELFPHGFRVERRPANGIVLNVCYDAAPTPTRPPLLLLHGFPQTHAMWHKVAERLSRSFTLVMPDLRGYGDSDKPEGPPDHSAYSKRTMALDVLTLMRGFGFEQFFVCGHAAAAESRTGSRSIIRHRYASWRCSISRRRRRCTNIRRWSSHAPTTIGSS
jgi:hypothetical protein